MTALVLLALLGSPLGVPPPAAAQSAGPAYPAVPQARDWMRLYPLRQYGAFWHLQVAVKQYPKARAAALQALEKAGARFTVPAELSAGGDQRRYQQFSVEIDRVKGGRALETLKRLGKVTRLTQTENPLPEVEREVPAKLARLREERRDGVVSFHPSDSGLPASLAALDEIAAHLEAVQTAYETSRDRVLFNIVVDGEPQSPG